MDITLESINQKDHNVRQSKKYKIIQSALNKVSVKNVSVNPNATAKLPFKFNHSLNESVTATNQFASGRCWIFAALNVIRHKMIKEHKLPEEFELSQAHIFKYDKIEKCNAALELMFTFAKKGYNHRSIHHAHIIPEILSDGGTIDQFINIVQKYGIVPKDIFPDTRQAKNTAIMNELIKHMIFKVSSEISLNTSRKDFERIKCKIMNDCHRIITLCLGNSPTEFEWNLHNTSKTKIYTPLSFYNTLVKPLINLTNYVCIVNDPRHAYRQLLAVEYLHNVIQPTDRDLRRKITNMYLNVDLKTFKDAVYKTISQEQVPVWFATDFHKFYLQDHSILDQSSTTLPEMFDIELLASKKQSMESGITVPNHAMVLTGCHKEGNQYVRWKVENSHGTDNAFKGFLTMSDDFFNEFMIVAFVHKATLPKSLYNIYKQKQNITWLPAWDILGVYA